jgi:negative regulator of sigma E activity
VRRRMPVRRGRPGLMGTVARTAVVAGTATAVVGGVHRHQEQNAAQQQQAEQAQQQQAAGQQQAMADQAAAKVQAQQAAAGPARSDDRIAKIKELGEMKAQGLLTEDEFAAEKARVLAS